MRQARVSSAITKLVIKLPGGSSEAAPPVPIPNTEVKRLSANDTALAKVWENRSLPGGFFAWLYYRLIVIKNRLCAMVSIRISEFDGEFFGRVFGTVDFLE